MDALVDVHFLVLGADIQSEERVLVLREGRGFGLSLGQHVSGVNGVAVGVKHVLGDPDLVA